MIEQHQSLSHQGHTDRWLWAIWISVIIGFAVVPVSVHLRYGGASDRNKDYDTWYMVGQQVLAGEEIYPLAESPRFNFMYPPVSACLIAPLTIAGKLPFILILEAANAVSWIFCVYAGVYLATGKAWGRPVIIYLVPTLATTAYVYDTFQLGQPNLMLLALLLAAFLCLRAGRQFGAGTLIALATAVKAFPVMLAVYLLWRRQYRALTGFLVAMAFLLICLPAPFRGFHRNVADLGTWTNAMVLSYDRGTIAQRPGQSYRWKNSSLIATANRLLRPIPADRKLTIHPQPYVPGNPNAGYRLIYANIANLDFRVVNFVILGAALAICLGFVAVMPAAKSRTPRTDAIEYAMLLVMMIMFSPISWFYYGVWLMYPLTVVMWYLHDSTNSRNQLRFALGGLIACLGLLNFVPPWDWYRSVRAIGTPFFGYLLMLLLLGWFLYQERRKSIAAADPLATNDETAPPAILPHAA